MCSLFLSRYVLCGSTLRLVRLFLWDLERSNLLVCLLVFMFNEFFLILSVTEI